MSQLIHIRNRIKAIETIKKITHAMRLISISTHAHLKQKEHTFDYYMQSLQALFALLSTANPTWHNPILHPDKQTSSRQLIIFIGSQKGLCGSFNNHLFKAFNYYTQSIDSTQLDIIVVGRKAVDYVRTQKNKSIIAQFPVFNNKNLDSIAQQITQIIMNTQVPYRSVNIVSSYLKSFFLQTPHKTALVPFSSPKKAAIDHQEPYIWEHDPHDILTKIAHLYICALIEHRLFQSLIAEQAARFISMDMATRNADKILESTQLTYNKLRQAKITKELTELTSSFSIF